MRAGADGRRTSLLLTIFSVGTIVHIWLLSRSWLGQDQIALLKLGQSFALTHELSPMGKGMSGGGSIPGSLLQLLIGSSLMLWQDYRAPLLLIGILTFISGLVILKVVRSWKDQSLALIFFALFWLSPWRLYHASVMWEPAFLFLPVALAFWASYESRSQARPIASLVLGAMLTLTPQIHGSFMWLWLVTLLLLVRKLIRVNWPALVAGALIGAITFIPMLEAIASGQAISSSLPKDQYIGTGVLLVYPVFKGALYWLRLPSLDLGVPLKEVVYFDHWAGSTWQSILVVLLRILQGISTATIALSVICYVWYFNKRKRRAPIEDPDELAWLEKYALVSFIALIVSAGLAPVTLQGWHVVIALHAAILPFALWVRKAVMSKLRGWLWLGYYCGVGLLIVFVVGLGKPTFRKGSLPSEARHEASIQSLLPFGLPYELDDTSRTH